MSLSALWDRFYWALMLAIFVGLLWLKFLDARIACMGPGLLVAVLVGGAYFGIGVTRMRRARRQELEAERQAEDA